ncbi:MAG TPA: SAM-dependent methyltransferase [Actinomycetota bacterium]|nr:SAM-dependent methyltransferase [Actinomycetota bacterium]
MEAHLGPTDAALHPGAARQGRLIPDAVPGSFRDPSGFVFVRDKTVFRQVNQAFADEYDLLMGSGLYASLVERGLLIPHEEVDELAAAEGAHRILRPEQIPFVSYPYEWCFSELKAAALATLDIQEAAMEHGMSLRDASAYNIQFRDGRPVLIDTLSFGRFDPSEPWVAYRQFCQQFLAPLALVSYRDARLGRLSQLHLDGVPLDLATELLPKRAGLKPSLQMHLFAHARSQRRHAGDGAAARSQTRRGGFNERSFRGVVSSLHSTVSDLTWSPEESAWTGYYDEAPSYSAEASEHKRTLVEAFVDRVRPESVWDLGGNTGAFARIASSRGIPTICFDADAACVERNYTTVVKDRERHLLPLVMDLTNPSPAIGLANRERSPLAERGPADMALALALVHHLAIGNNVPLDLLADDFRELCAWLVVEFVPKQDPRVQDLLAMREDVFPGYTRDGFEAAFGRRFVVERAEELRDSSRVLYLMRGQ